MAEYQIRVVGKRREQTDEKRLAEALLVMIDKLSESDRKKLAAAGEKALRLRAKKHPRGSAA